MNYATGLSGFLGTHLSKRLEITNIPHQDITTVKLAPFNFFFFLSTYGNLASQNNIDYIYKANILDLLSILIKSKRIKFKSLVFMSSSSVMLKSQTTYSRCKKAAEELVLSFMEKTNLSVIIIRPFSITGVGEQKEHLIPTLIDAAFTGKTVNFVSNPTHDYIDVEDVIDGMLSLVENNARGIFQLGTGIKTTNQEVLNLVEKVTGKKINTNMVSSLRPYDNDNWVSTNFRARMYGWLPRKSLEQSITEMVAEYERSNNAS